MKKYDQFSAASKVCSCALLIFFCISLQAQNPHGVLTIRPGAVLSIGKNACLVTNTNVNNQGTLKNTGSIILNGNATQSFPGTGGNIPTMSVLELKNTGGGMLLNRAIKIDKELKLTSGNLALGNYDVTIKSTATQTAAISAIGPGAGVSYGAGRFVIERYINIGAGGHGKSWQLLAVPAIGQTIRDCWQEAGATNVGYGTQLTHPLGTAAGYDLYSPNASIKTFSNAIDNYDQGPSSTNALIDNPKGYMVFVRGDRTVSSGSGTTPTVLRTRGTIYTPSSPAAPIGIIGGKYESVGNPYACQVDFTKLIRTGGVDNKFYTWDPTIGGLYGVGAYQTITATNGWVPVPGGGNYSGTHKTIESGQAFLVHSSTTSGTIGFIESAKTGADKLLNRTTTDDETSITRQFIRSSLINNSGLLSDGNAVAFDTDLNNVVDVDDASKILKTGENFGLKRDNILLAVEGRNLIETTDTLFYFTSNLTQQTYSVLIVPQNMDQTKQAWLVDNFLQTETPVSLSDSSKINFSVTANPLSARADRLMLVFKPQTILDIASTTLQAKSNDDGSIALQWITNTENAVKEYTLEKSANGTTFTAIATKNASMNNGATANYQHLDLSPLTGNNFYRVKVLFLNGTVKYSAIAKLEVSTTKSDISVYPNPLTARSLNLYLGKRASGNYELVLVNAAGQQVWSSKILYSNSAAKLNIQLPQQIVAGNYQLKILNTKSEESFVTAVTIL